MPDMTNLERLDQSSSEKHDIFTNSKCRCDIFQVPDGRKHFPMSREITKKQDFFDWTGLGIAHFSRKGDTFLEKLLLFVKNHYLRGMGTTKIFSLPEKKICDLQWIIQISHVRRIGVIYIGFWVLSTWR